MALHGYTNEHFNFQRLLDLMYYPHFKYITNIVFYIMFASTKLQQVFIIDCLRKVMY